MSDEYNGWANRETWAASLHLSNDEGLYNRGREIVADAVAQSRADAERLGIEPSDGMMRAGEALAEWIEDMRQRIIVSHDDATVTMMVDEIGSRWRVEWADVARSFIDE